MSKIIETLKFSSLIASKKLQCRVALNEDALADYTDHAKSHKAAGTDPEFPAFIVYRDPEGGNHLAAGYTRKAALKAAGYDEYKCEVREGDARAAWLAGCQDNSRNGSRLTNKDKHNILDTALEDKELVQLSSNGLAGMLGLTQSFVDRNRPKSKTPGAVVAVRKSGKKGVVKTDNIGKKTGKKKPAAKKPAKNQGEKDAKRVEKEQATQKAAEDKIVDAVGGADKGKLRTALRDGSLGLPPGDVVKLAARAPKQIAQIVPLVTDMKMGLAKAVKTLDTVIGSKSRVEEVELLAIAGEGSTKQPIEGSDFVLVCYNAKKFSVEITPR